MQEYIFLFVLAGIWSVFASVQDLKKREVANWITFSLVIFALVYRAFYSIFIEDASFFLYGLFGFVLFVILAHVFYYGRVFAGGDAKLLMGFGIILPYNSLFDLLTMSISFLFVLFAIGAIYSLGYSFYLVGKNKNKFTHFFKEYFIKFKVLEGGVIIFALVIFFIFLDMILIPFLILLVLLPIFYVYLKAVEKSSLVVMVLPSKLEEGDWLEEDVKIGNKWIRKNVHGLSFEEIVMLKKARKKVLIKQGVPFVPVFLLTLVIMVYASVVLEAGLVDLFSVLF